MQMHLIALHHAEVELAPTASGATGTMYGNEGIRIARVIEGLKAASVPHVVWS